MWGDIHKKGGQSKVDHPLLFYLFELFSCRLHIVKLHRPFRSLLICIRWFLPVYSTEIEVHTFGFILLIQQLDIFTRTAYDSTFSHLQFECGKQVIRVCEEQNMHWRFFFQSCARRLNGIEDHSHLIKIFLFVDRVSKFAVDECEQIECSR